MGFRVFSLLFCKDGFAGAFGGWWVVRVSGSATEVSLRVCGGRKQNWMPRRVTTSRMTNTRIRIGTLENPTC